MEFLGGFSKSIAGYEDANAWFADTFDGILVEQNAAGDEGRIRYRIWDNLKGLPESRKKYCSACPDRPAGGYVSDLGPFSDRDRKYEPVRDVSEERRAGAGESPRHRGGVCRKDGHILRSIIAVDE